MAEAQAVTELVRGRLQQVGAAELVDGPVLLVVEVGVAAELCERKRVNSNIARDSAVQSWTLTFLQRA